eukprot:TRINITY_DN22373_c0_g2_i1.p1 TRINITY_DN22373_c0_g2~~TRINITY_DN22373_c0_g2_i1.p1  ORF type:complete len:946 (+),score=239.10 TRINITY_DN22373_c0_g2_i1:406-2838(+)
MAAFAAAPLDLGVELVAYDGGVPELKPSMFPESCRAALARWATGKTSGSLALLHIEHWTQGEVAWIEESPGMLQQRLGLVAGMLADPSFERATIANLHGSVFATSPLVEAKAAADEVLAKAQPGESLLVSEVEHALAIAESIALGGGPVAKLRAAVRRELLRAAWTPTSISAKVASPNVEDIWLLGELAKNPQAVADSARAASVEKLRDENDRLDAYLIRLIRLKRAMVTLMDGWEKVDYYAILGVSSTVSDKELKVAYRKACLRLHPDKGGDKELFQQLQDAYAKVLEERAVRKDGGGGGGSKGGDNNSASGPRTGGGNGAAAANGATSGAARGRGAGKQLALEGPTATGEQVADNAPDCSEVASAEMCFREQTEAALRHVGEAVHAEARILKLKHAFSEDDSAAQGYEALREAQEAGNLLLATCEQLGILGPALGDAAMEVAESSLDFAARFAAKVPSALLLTDVALSCTFEASRMKHAGSHALDVRRDTQPTLQTLETNLGVAKIIGTVDSETFRLSLGLVDKAAKRIMAAVRQISAAVTDALQRARQCRTHARSVAAFAVGRAAADAAAFEEDVPSRGTMALPPAPSDGSAKKDGARGDAASDGHTAGGKDSGPSTQTSAGEAAAGGAFAPVSGGGMRSALLESRLQSDRLLRQLNNELIALQRRARGHLTGRAGTAKVAEVPTEARASVLSLAAELLSEATEAVFAAFEPSMKAFQALLTEHFQFVETCGQNLAMPVDVRAQLVRLAALVDSQALLFALDKHAKVRLAGACDAAAATEDREPLLASLERHFEQLGVAVVAARMAA